MIYATIALAAFAAGWLAKTWAVSFDYYGYAPSADDED